MDIPNDKLKEQLESIASQHLSIPTLTRQDSDRLDFHDVAVWNIEQALRDAVELGRKIQHEETAAKVAAAQRKQERAESGWRRLALQFDGHRMQAIGHLRSLLQDPARHREQAEKFLAAGPLSGEKVLANRIKAMAKQLLATRKAAKQ